MTRHICGLQLLHGQDEEGPLHKVPLWNREDLDDACLVGEFQRECRVMRKGVNGDLIKVRLLKECKTITIPWAKACHHCAASPNDCSTYSRHPCDSDNRFLFNSMLTYRVLVHSVSGTASPLS